MHLEFVVVSPFPLLPRRVESGKHTSKDVGLGSVSSMRLVVPHMNGYVTTPDILVPTMNNNLVKSNAILINFPELLQAHSILSYVKIGSVGHNLQILPETLSNCID